MVTKDLEQLSFWLRTFHLHVVCAHFRCAHAFIDRLWVAYPWLSKAICPQLAAVSPLLLPSSDQ